VSAIVAQDVSKTYRGGVQALRGVTIAVEPGEIFGLLGPNGAGKTTLVKILLDLVRPTRGSASILDVSARRPIARRDVGYLPEDHRFPEYNTAESAMHFYGGLSGLGGSALRERTKELLGVVGLAGAAKKKVRGYSKGMKQRLGLAQALIAEPKVLFLDEPTDGVDPIGRAEIRGILERQKELGRTIFLNSHLLSEVEQVCDRVAILRSGEVARSGSIEELTRAELVYTLTTATPLPAEILAELATLAGHVVSARAGPGGVEIGVAKEEAIDHVIDLLRARGVAIRGLVGKRHSLEEVFLESMKSAPRASTGAGREAGAPGGGREAGAPGVPP